MLSARRLQRERRGGTTWCSSSPTSSTASPNSTSSSRWSWCSRDTEITQNTEIGMSAETKMDDPPASPTSPVTDEEHSRILKARQRLARREIELQQIIRHCNSQMDIVRRKLVKDLQVMEVLKEEIDKAGTGDLREQLERDFHDGIRAVYLR